MLERLGNVWTDLIRLIDWIDLIKFTDRPTVKYTTVQSITSHLPFMLTQQQKVVILGTCLVSEQKCCTLRADYMQCIPSTKRDVVVT